MWRRYNPIHFVSIEHESNKHNNPYCFFRINNCIFLVYIFPLLLFNVNHYLSTQHELLPGSLKGKSKKLSCYAMDKIYLKYF